MVDEKPEGREALEDEASEGSMAPSAELEEAMREAAEAVEAREGAQRDPTDRSEAPAELAAAQAEVERLTDAQLRLQADFENHRKRALRDRQESHKFGHENLVKDLLATVDNLERALDHARSSGSADFEAMLQGVELVRREFLGALAKHGVTAVEADGERFDPEFHEAMAQEIDDSVPAGTVVKVFEKGYRIWDRLLRPARVVVSKSSEGSESAGSSGE